VQLRSRPAARFPSPKRNTWLGALAGDPVRLHVRNHSLALCSGKDTTSEPQTMQSHSWHRFQAEPTIGVNLLYPHENHLALGVLGDVTSLAYPFELFNSAL
jgi:hypothetical protein